MVDLSKMDQKSIGKCFDYAILPKYTDEATIREGAAAAIESNCAALNVNTSYWLPLCCELLEGSTVLPSCCIDFPFGSSMSVKKALETELAVKLGGKAIDMAMNVGAMRSGKYDDVKMEIFDFVKAAQGNITKLIMDVGFLTDDEIRIATEFCVEAGVTYAKTATGQYEGPTMEQFLIMKSVTSGTKTGIKVSGVKYPRPQNAYAFLVAGADLIGTRSAPEIIAALPLMREIGIVPAYQG